MWLPDPTRTVYEATIRQGNGQVTENAAGDDFAEPKDEDVVSLETEKSKDET